MKTVFYLFVVSSALIEVAANLMLEKSNGFRNKAWGFGAIAMVWVAFALLGQAVRGIDLAVAYALWGALGIIGTAIGARIFFGQRLKPLGWAGMAIVISSVVVLTTA
ncbi:spermidine export protein MdtI [Chromobacterium alkanivorans]|uniref:SMR family transporter n=1 Tax=Chromobacterium TaxID=535 RepID=UPI000652B2BA|nr:MULTISPECIES: SMR family transporter [Chromobacterium]KMN77995.1 ligand-binding protein SH3 [Chromobacterium sp. LK11]MBN3002878.1 ligand-binding protein SH3 [Chromobacterium alkanivorans]MCS3803963.1 spermidine export protein MdtI [Chromobacterium alkanivorans]MCS3817932.1 spermidine export protein MdtI [Chromobacterium alkanivorans]MCS3875552.1 spermidine export protein MdtI [Chromobacterium alkanivorans]